MRLPINVVVPGVRGLCMTGALLLGATRTEAQAANGAKLDPGWLRADAASKTAELKLVGGLTDQNGGMNFNGFSRGTLVLMPSRAVLCNQRSNMLLPAGWSRASRPGRAPMSGSLPGRPAPFSSFVRCLVTGLRGCGFASPSPRPQTSRRSLQLLSADGTAGMCLR